jgi:hypothetical protein
VTGASPSSKDRFMGAFNDIEHARRGSRGLGLSSTSVRWHGHARADELDQGYRERGRGRRPLLRRSDAL